MTLLNCSTIDVDAADRESQSPKYRNSTLNQVGSSIPSTSAGGYRSDRAGRTELKTNSIDFEDIEVVGIRDDDYRTVVVDAQNTDRHVLEHFLGQVTAIDGNLAYVTLIDPNGIEIYGSRDAATFSGKGILLGDWFDCDTVKVGLQVIVEISRRHRIPLPEQMKQRMADELSKGLEGLD